MSLFPPDELDIARQRHHGDYVSLPWLTTDYIGFNVRQAPFIDPRVRRAFVMALDREILADIKMIGTVFPATGGFIPPGMPSHSPGIALAYDPDQARQLLSMAGYPDGRDFPLVDALTRKGREAQTDYLQEQWHQVLGVNINWQAWESGVFLDKLDHDPPSIFIIKWMADYPDPDSFLRVCPARHYTGWWDEAYNILVEEAKFVKDKAERLKMYQDADKKLIEAAAILPLCYQRIHLLVKPWVKRFPTSALERWFWKDVIIEPH
jgi:ABC-type transport system substrate-binding protein